MAAYHSVGQKYLGVRHSLASHGILVTYAGTRTYSNSMEMFFIALSYYFYIKGRMNWWNIAVGCSCLMRPTGLINWMGVYCLMLLRKDLKEILRTSVIA